MNSAPCATFFDVPAEELGNVAASFGTTDEDAVTIQEIKSAILADTEEVLDSIGGLTLRLETRGATTHAGGTTLPPS